MPKHYFFHANRLNYFSTVGRRGPNSQTYTIYSQHYYLDPKILWILDMDSGSSWNRVGYEQVRKKEDCGKGLKIEPVQWLLHTRSAPTPTLGLPAYYQSRKGVLLLPEIRIAPKTKGGEPLFSLCPVILGDNPWQGTKKQPTQRGREIVSMFPKRRWINPKSALIPLLQPNLRISF